jgi:hypothetical protein
MYTLFLYIQSQITQAQGEILTVCHLWRLQILHCRQEPGGYPLMICSALVPNAVMHAQQHDN